VLQSVEVCGSACSQLHDVLQYVQVESWCIAVRASSCALQCVAVCCSVLQCVAECCSVLQCVAVCCSTRKQLFVASRGADRVKVMQPNTHAWLRIALVRCSVLQCVAAKFASVFAHALVEKPAMVLVILSSQRGSG